jgi:dihydropyrimidinase
LETCPQYLLLDRKLYWPKSGDDSFAGARFVMSPPLRGKADREALWRGVKSGAVQVVATDHCPFFLSQKDRGREDFTAIPNGAPGVEHRMELLFSEGVLKRRMSLNRFVDVTSAAPAKIFGLYPKKGRIAVGADADIVIMDPRDRHVISASSHHMNCDYSAYEGWRVHGKCWITMLRGNVASIDGKVNIPAEFGKFLPRKPLKY